MRSSERGEDGAALPHAFSPNPRKNRSPHSKKIGLVLENNPARNTKYLKEHCRREKPLRRNR